ncbi:hypothetical protein VOA_003391 [Vibrio sp. RC586]|uniref:LysR family transcriptional regulator n=1 Tax=Vibrio sp. RC586 TaxID=675815 RepID=UPI0001BB867D|nr:LysR family transcriptional regulator [Vibrio sp. RC586]EEZ00941.1 hypothetical protein VOA_003391 [Vibrio sp. RC586]
MNLDDLTLFIQVVELKSFTRAAEVSGLPKSTVSRRIRALEDSLQTRLLERTTRSLTLTEVGEAFLHRAQKILQQVEETQQQITKSQGEFSGTLTLYGEEYLFDLCSEQISDFFERYPELSLTLHSHSENSQQMMEKRFDLMLMVGEQPDSSFIAVPLAKLQFDLYISPQLALKAKGTLSDEALLQTQPIALQEVAMQQCWPHTAFPLNRPPRFCVQSPRLLTDIVLQGKAIGCLPVAYANHQVHKGKLKTLFKGQYRFAQTIYGVYHSRWYVPAKVKLLLEDIRQQLPSLLAELEKS